MDTFSRIRQWAEDRNLIKGSTPGSQMLKLVEELGELANSINKNRREELKDGIGDVVVVLTIIAEMHGVLIEDCIDAAYDEIKDRKGKMINGTFVKEADIPPSPKRFVYKDIEGSVHYHKEVDIWFGRLLGVEGLYTYEASTEESLEDYFRSTVLDYLIDKECSRQSQTVANADREDPELMEFIDRALGEVLTED